MIREMWDEGWVGCMILIIMASISVLLVFAVNEAIDEQHEWKKFSADHNCKVVSHVNPISGIGVSTSGNAVVVTNPEQTGYLCNDGITYWR